MAGGRLRNAAKERVFPTCLAASKSGRQIYRCLPSIEARPEAGNLTAAARSLSTRRWPSPNVTEAPSAGRPSPFPQAQWATTRTVASEEGGGSIVSATGDRFGALFTSYSDVTLALANHSA
jgi:hypothetical protein